MKTVCPVCQLEVPEGALLCPRDGTQLERTVVQAQALISDETPLPQLDPMATSDETPLPQPDPTVIRHSSELEPHAPTVLRRSAALATPGDDGLESTITSLPSNIVLDASLQLDPLIGTRAGEYVIQKVLGEGGMGVVYEAVHPMIGKRVAIKLLKREIAANPEEAARLLTEATSANAVGHRGIIDIFGFGTLADGRQYFVMEYLVGRPLADVIAREAPLPIDRALELLDEILAPLGAAHAAGVIHRDLKPSNIFLVDQPDGSTFVKILDFGLAKKAPTARGETPQTRVSRVIGTPEYMAPEQARGDAVSPRTDLYAVGVFAFELLTGQLPFTAGTAWEIVTMHLNAVAPRPSSCRSDLPEELDALVLKLLEKAPADRPDSAEAVRQELRRLRRTLRLAETRVGAPPEPEVTQRALPMTGAPPRASPHRTPPGPRPSASRRPISLRRSGSAPPPEDQEVTAEVAHHLPPIEGAPALTAPRSRRLVVVGLGAAAGLALATAAWLAWPPGTQTAREVVAPIVDLEEIPLVELDAGVPAPVRPVKPPAVGVEVAKSTVGPATHPERSPVVVKRRDQVQRFRAVNEAWQRVRGQHSEQDQRVFDAALASLKLEASKRHPDQKLLRESLDDLVREALRGVEP